MYINKIFLRLKRDAIVLVVAEGEVEVLIEERDATKNEERVSESKGHKEN